MTLAHPWFLLLLLVVPPLLWLRWWMVRKQTMHFSDGRVLKALPGSWRTRLQPLIPLLHVLGIVCLIIALARPQKGLDDSRVRTEAVDIILLLDLSTSMEERDFQKFGVRMSRLDATKDVINRFLDNRPNDRVGMVAFAALPYAVAPLTLDHEWLKLRMEGLYAGALPDGTAIGDGIASAVNRLLDSEAKSKVIILLTDGANNQGTLSPENAASAAEAVGVKIYTIGAGGARGASGGFFQRRPQVDEDTLQKVAVTTGAKFYRARDLETLEAVYEEIDQLEKTEIEVERFSRFEEKFFGWLVAGIGLLVMEQLLGLSRLGRLP